DLLKAGRVDAIEEIEPFAGIAIAAGGVALGDPFRSIGDRAFVGYWLPHPAWAHKNQDVVLRYTQAVKKAAHWVAANPDEARVFLSSYTGLQGPALGKTPILDFSFAPTVPEIQKQLVPDQQTWNAILKRTSDIRPVAAGDLLPGWAK